MQELGPPLKWFSSNNLCLSSVIKSNLTPVVFQPAFRVNDGVLYEYIVIIP